MLFRKLIALDFEAMDVCGSGCLLCRGLSFGCMRLPEATGGDDLVVPGPEGLAAYRLMAARRRGGGACLGWLLARSGFALASAVEHPVEVLDVHLPARI
jgi:hypothetical protein